MNTETITAQIPLAPVKLLSAGSYDRDLVLVGTTFAAGTGRILAPTRDGLIASRAFPIDANVALVPNGFLHTLRVPRGSDLWALQTAAVANNLPMVVTEISRPTKLPRASREFRTGRVGLGTNIPMKLLQAGRAYDTECSFYHTVNNIVYAVSRDNLLVAGRRFTPIVAQGSPQIIWGRGSDLWVMNIGGGTPAFQFIFADLAFDAYLHAARTL